MRRAGRYSARFGLAAMLLAGLPMGAGAQTPAPSGPAPAYAAGKPLSTVPNAQAIIRRFWAPGLDEGQTPQGLAVAGGRVHVATYGPGGCRVYGLSMTNGAILSQTNAPECKHGGGLAALPGGRLLLADTHALFVIAGGQVTRRISLEGALLGSFADFDGTALWIGSYTRMGPGAIWRLPLSALSRDALSEADATATLSIAEKAQGLTFGGGRIWLTHSGSGFGRLAALDAATGREVASYDMPAGIEDIAYANGVIWAVSEAGARLYTGWATHFPLVFALDQRKLR